jgi:hypothetical protein
MQGRKVLLAAALSLMLGGAALAQDRDHARDRRDDRGRATAQWRQNDRDRDRDRDWDRDDRYRRNRTYPNGTYYPSTGYPNGAYGMYGSRNSALNQAQQIGYQDGLSDGSKDRGHHSYRPTDMSNFKHANRGWSSSMINRDDYSQAYRQAYLQGYQRGYGLQQQRGGYGSWPY